MTDLYSADRSFSQAGDRLWGDHDPAEAVPYALVSIAASLRDIADLMRAQKPSPMTAHELRGVLGLNPLGGGVLDARSAD